MRENQYSNQVRCIPRCYTDPQSNTPCNGYNCNGDLPLSYEQNCLFWSDKPEIIKRRLLE